MNFCTELETWKGARDRRGSAAVVAIVAVVVLVGLCGAMLMIATRTADERVATVDRHQALAAAHAGIGHAMVALTEDDDVRQVGTPDEPVAFGGGSYWATITPEGNAGAFTVASFATVRGETEAVEALLDGASLDIYDHALFAGNSSGDPRYSMRLGGSGTQADLINGDVYSGGGVIVSGDATVTGTIRADGTIVGASGETDVIQPIPDIAAMDYPRTADFKVAALFAGAAYKSDDAGGKAWQLPESSPAHIFRKNPSDRASDNDSTRKDDYYLEDPYEPVNSDGGSNGSNPYPITLSGVSGEPGINGNKKVYYIDGNLWIHNKNTFSFEIQHDLAAGVQVTFVAKGNIYFSDNVFYDDVEKDGIAFIAMKDSAEADSGNIYFGDPLFGTLEQMHAFMYAENNFVDKNLSATGSAQVAVYGNMTAGNKVDIQRDFDGQHSKLTVNYDGRISSGDLKMPGLPRTPDADDGDLRLTAWRRIPEQ
jgi:hypothetical protein